MHTTPARLAAIGLAAALALPLYAAPAAAQNVRTFAQMQQRFPILTPRQIEICDHDGNGLYDRGEQACVSSMNDVMRQN